MADAKPQFSESHACGRCGRLMTRMEGVIGIGDTVQWLCHPDAPDLPDCYTITSHEASEAMYSAHALLRVEDLDPLCRVDEWGYD